MADLSESFDPLDTSDVASSALVAAAAASDTASKASDTASVASVAAAKGSEASSKILAQSAAWEAGGTPTEIVDADNDTKVQTEESGDEDKIRFDIGGTERLVIHDGWIDQQFNNLLKNGSFEDSALPVANTPSGWTLEGTPTVAVETTNIAIGYGTRSAKITGTGAGNEGLKQTVTGLKVSTVYTILWRSMATDGDTARLLTTGATANADTDVTATSMTQSVDNFTTDGSGTDVVLKVVAKADTDIVYFDNIIVVEGALAPAYCPHPNHQHLKAIHYQDAVPANFDFGLLRMECGYTKLVLLGANTLQVTVTFGTAFSKILSVQFIPVETGQTGVQLHQDADHVLLASLTNNTVVISIIDDAASFIAGNFCYGYWLAIGVM